VVLPDGILTNSSLQPIRDWLIERFQLLAIVSLPQFAFSHYGAGVKASIVFLRKRAADETPNDDEAIFMAAPARIGYDATGRKTSSDLPGSRAPILRVQRKRRTFFRLSPAAADADALVCFAVRRGGIYPNFGVENARFETFIRPAAEARARFPIQILETCLAAPLMNGIFKKKEFFGRGVLLVNVWDLYRDEMIDPASLDRVEVSEFEEARFQVNEGDVLFCRSSLKPEGVGWSCLVGAVKEPSAFECHLIKATSRKTRLLPEYLNHYTKTMFARSYVVAKATVTTMATIDQGAIEALPIILPELHVQRKLIAEMQTAREARKQKLREADELLASLDAYLLETLRLALRPGESRLTYGARLSDVRQSSRCDPQYHAPRYQKLVKAFALCPHSKVQLGRISPEIVGGATPTRGDAALYDIGGIKFLRILNVKANEFDLSDLNYIRPEVHEGELKRSQ
jgi:type I restriction enzyme M protein